MFKRRYYYYPELRFAAGFIALLFIGVTIGFALVIKLTYRLVGAFIRKFNLEDNKLITGVYKYLGRINGFIERIRDKLIPERSWNLWFKYYLSIYT